MNIFFIVASFLFFIWASRNILFWVSLWQLKEYRLDRLLIHLWDTKQGRSLLFSPLSILKWIALFVYVLVFFESDLLLFYYIFLIAIYTLQDFTVYKEISLRIIKRPVLTFKTLTISSVAFAVLLLLFFLPPVDRFLWLVLVDRIIVIAIAFFVFLFSFPTEIYHDWKIDKAVKMIRKHKKLLVIGVTGSYGKSSAKDYVSQILEKKFKVLKTQGTNNTPIGIANTILKGLKNSTEIFVVEMGAYKRGEIAQMCQMVYPKIGVLTAVNSQHLPLFGSIENTMAAKYELIDALPENGLALFNGNNENALKLYEKTEKKKALYRRINTLVKAEGLLNLKKKSYISAFNIVTFATSISFDVQLENKKLSLNAPLIGAHNIENILPGIYIGSYLGMKEDEIKEAVSSLTPLSKTMTKYKSKEGVNIIDDTFNANPQAVLALLQYLKVYRGKKVLVLQPMIELGQEAHREHLRVAKEIARICDFLLLTNGNYYKDMLSGIAEGNKNCVVKVGNSFELSKFINENVGKNDAVAFEGKEAAHVLNKTFPSLVN